MLPCTATTHKHRKLTVSWREQLLLNHAEQAASWKQVYSGIQTLIKSTKTQFVGGHNGLQSRRALAIQSHLQLMLKDSRKTMNASERAAESHGFVMKWGGHSLRAWTKQWINTRVLPGSFRGCHGKIYSLLSDTAIVSELRAYVRSNKWAMNPGKLA